MSATGQNAAEPKWITLGHPSYVWRFGQDRRLALIRRYVRLEGKSILDVGCGLGTYVAKLLRFSEDVHGIDVDPERVAEASKTLSNIRVAVSEKLPYESSRFDVVLLNEVIEHVEDDRRTIAECVRVLRRGGSVVIYAPNRLYPFETHGVYVGKRFVFGNIPLVGYLPNPLRRLLAPHVRAYTHGGIEELFAGQPVDITRHSYVYPGFDNVAARSYLIGRALRAVFYFLESTPFQRLGLSHFVVARKR